MEKIEEFFVNPIDASLFGWLAFNIWCWSQKKDEFDAQDKPFNLIVYLGKVYDNWIASFVAIPLLLFVGYSGLDIPLAMGDVKWSSLYYLLAGVIPEFAMEKYKNFKKSNSEKPII